MRIFEFFWLVCPAQERSVTYALDVRWVTVPGLLKRTSRTSDSGIGNIDDVMLVFLIDNESLTNNRV